MDYVVRNKSGITVDSHLSVILLDTGKIKKKTYF